MIETDAQAYRPPHAMMEPPAIAPSEAELADWHQRLRGLSAADALALAIGEFFPRRIALVSSFGAEAAILLHFVAEIDRHLPILFLDTEKHFDATLTYRDILVDRFGFTDLRILRPAGSDIAGFDPDGDLHRRNPDRCCHIRKVLPLDRALAPFSAWISGRKRFQTSDRRDMPILEAVAGRIKINPLAYWSANDIDAAFKFLRLPRHPLLAEGYGSIGCAPCTRPLSSGEDSRAGRWSGSDKSECGIHRA